jgi:hypothetical protein
MKSNYFCFRKNISNYRTKNTAILFLLILELFQRQNELSLENAGGIKPYIAISHVYDSLFDHSERNRQKSLWDKIVKYISDNESRIRVETQFNTIKFKTHNIQQFYT